MGRANQSGEAWLDARPEPAKAARRLLTAGASMEPRPCWLNAGGGKITYEYTSARAGSTRSPCRRRCHESPAPTIRSASSGAATHPVEYPDCDSGEEQQPEPFDLETVNRRLAELGSGQP